MSSSCVTIDKYMSIVVFRGLLGIVIICRKEASSIGIVILVIYWRRRLICVSQ